MTYVYILRSLRCSGKTFIGITRDLQRCLREHNRGGLEATKAFAPWQIETYIVVANSETARQVEYSLRKSGGWKFARERCGK